MITPKMTVSKLLCYLNFAEACVVHAALQRAVTNGEFTEEAVKDAKELLTLMEDAKHGTYNVQSLPAHHIVP